MVDLTWDVTVNLEGRTAQDPPFVQRFQQRGMLSKELGLATTHLGSETTCKNIGTKALLAALGVKPLNGDATDSFVRGIAVHLGSLPVDSYFSVRLLEARSCFWQGIPHDYASPLLRFSQFCDEPAIYSLLLLGAGLSLTCNRYGIPSMAVTKPAHSTVDQARIADWLYAAVPEECRSASPTNPEPDTNRWHTPRFSLRREPYAQPCRLRPQKAVFEDTSLMGLAALLDKCGWLEYVKVRYSPGSVYFDCQLLVLLAGAALMLPALLLWQTRFSDSATIDSSATALEAMIGILLAQDHHCDPVARECFLIGIRPRQLGLFDKRVGLVADWDDDMVAALRLLLREEEYLLFQHLDHVALEEGVLA